MCYYGKFCDSRALFDGLSISLPNKIVDGKMEDKQFEKHLNKYPVIYLDITDFTTKYSEDTNIVSCMQESLITEILSIYPEVQRSSTDDLMDLLIQIAENSGEKFIMIIDEWDAIGREYEKDSNVMDIYVNFLRSLFKGSNSKRIPKEFLLEFI